MSFADDIANDLRRTPRQLPSKYFYDALGSALFDAICQLPWYRITRAELGLLAARAGELLAPIGNGFDVAELGCGSGEKLAVLLAPHTTAVREVHLVDISAAALAAARKRLLELGLTALHAYRAAYEDGLAALVASRAPGRPLVILFLGSNIGNFDAAEAAAFLRAVRGALRPGDLFLLGADLVKPEDELLLAYADPLGVTAAFNLNLLQRINAELGGHFDLSAWAHRAVWNAQASRIEMHLVSQCRQRVRVEAINLDVTVEAGETIWTESSYKYLPEALVAAGQAAGFARAEQWVDPVARFALTRFTV